MMFDLRKIFKLLNGVLVALVSVFSAPAGADNAAQLQQIDAAYDARDYGQVIRLLQPFAQQGNVDAQYNLGMMYLDGKGVAQNYKQAMVWFQKAAQQGDIGAQ